MSGRRYFEGDLPDIRAAFPVASPPPPPELVAYERAERRRTTWLRTVSAAVVGGGMGGLLVFAPWLFPMLVVLVTMVMFLSGQSSGGTAVLFGFVLAPMVFLLVKPGPTMDMLTKLLYQFAKVLAP